MREGTFDIPSGLKLTALDSNTTYRSFGNEEVTLRGGKTLKVSEMSVAEDSRIKATAAGKVLKVNLTQKGIAAPALGITGHSSYYTKLEGYGGGDVDSSVYADGEMLTPARYPNDGYMTIESVTVNGDFTNKQGMSFTTSDSEYSNWQNATDAYVCGYWYYDWSNLTTPVSTISGNTITTTIPSPYGLRSGQRFYIYHLLEELDAPGEWFYDKSTGDFYIYPPENSAEITICSEVKDILKLTTANSVNIYGLNIECSGGNGISVNESKYVILSGCDIKGASVNGVSVGGSDNLVENCVISAVGETGVGIGGGDTTTLTPSRNTVKNCVVSDCARLVKTYAPNIRLNGVGSTAIGNIISGNPHCAVVFSGNDHKILNNDISNVVYEVSDMGAIYAGGSGITRGNIISGNSFRNLHSNSTHTSEHNIYGVYLDDCFASAEITGNTFENIDGSGVFVNGGRDNVVTNNSFSDIKVDGIKLSTAGTTDWYEDDESFISGLNYNSSFVTSKPYQKYPHLADILDDDYRYPKYNVITGNTFNNCANNIKLDIYNSTLSESDVRAMNTIQ